MSTCAPSSPETFAPIFVDPAPHKGVGVTTVWVVGRLHAFPPDDTVIAHFVSEAAATAYAAKLGASWFRLDDRDDRRGLPGLAIVVYPVIVFG